MSGSKTPAGLLIESCEGLELLSTLFLELAEDERSDIRRTKEKALEDMNAFLGRGEKAYVFIVNGGVAGYALVDVSRKPYYLHHFYICRGERRRGLGTAAFKLLLETLETSEIDLDVYAWNDRGRAFWESLGFQPRAIIMRYQP